MNKFIRPFLKLIGHGSLARNSKCKYPSRPVRIYFLGLLNGRWPMLRRSTFRHLRKLEDRVPGESEALTRVTGLKRTLFRKQANIVFARNSPDDTTEKEYTKLKRIANKLPNHVLQINPLNAFHNHVDKIRTFNHWKRANIPCPEFIALPKNVHFDERFKIVLQFMKRFGAILLRTNNQGAGSGLYILDDRASEARITQVLKQLDKRIKEPELSRRNTRIIAVKILKKDTPLAEARVFVVGNQLLTECSIGRIIPTQLQQLSVSEQANYHDYCNYFKAHDISKADITLFHEANYQLKQRLQQDQQLSKQCLQAVRVLGNNIGALDLIFCKGKPIFLEINARFGVSDFAFDSMGHYRAAMKDIWKVITTQDFYEQIYAAVLEAYWAR